MINCTGSLRLPVFVESFGFMSHVALLAENAVHHPEWFNVYNTVRIDLAIHDVSEISQADFNLASRLIDSVAIEALLSYFSPKDRFALATSIY